MRVLHLSTWNTGGAAKAATRLSSTLNDLRIDSRILHMSSRLPAYVDAAIGKLTRTINLIFHSYNYFGENISAQIAQFKPDLIHIHWVGAGFIRPESLANFNLPIVWTLHDFWPLCGAEHIHGSITRYRHGYLPNNRPAGESGLDLDRLVWERKLKSFQGLNLTYVAPSRYVKRLAGSAKAIKGHRLEYIPNGLDVKLYRPGKNKHPGKPTIFFAAMNPKLDPNKGYADFVKAIALLPPQLRDQVEVKTIGGEITSEAEMVRLYQTATVTVVPSRIENLSFVSMESLACGTPVVAYRVGGIPDLVTHQKNGYLAKSYDVKDLAKGIIEIITNPKLVARYGRVGRETVLKYFDQKKMAQAYLKLYRELI